MKTYFILFLTCFLSFFYSTLYAQNENDVLYINEARLAIEKYGDYDSGIKSLNKLSSEAKKNPIFSLYMAKAYEGKRDNEKTLYYYQQYANQTSLTPELIEKIADLRYRLNKEEDIKKQKDDIAKRIQEEEEEKINVSGEWKVRDVISYSGLNNKWIEPPRIFFKESVIYIEETKYLAKHTFDVRLSKLKIMFNGIENLGNFKYNNNDKRYYAKPCILASMSSGKNDHYFYINKSDLYVDPPELYKSSEENGVLWLKVNYVDKVSSVFKSNGFERGAIYFKLSK